MIEEIFARLTPPPTLKGTPPPWRFVQDITITRHFGVTPRTLAKWREKPNTPRFAFDDRKKGTYWYQPGEMLLWAYRFRKDEDQILSEWFRYNLGGKAIDLADQVRFFERAIPDTTPPDFLRYPSLHARFATAPSTST